MSCLGYYCKFLVFSPVISDMQVHVKWREGLISSKLSCGIQFHLTEDYLPMGRKGHLTFLKEGAVKN